MAFNNLNWNDLKFFLMVARDGSLAKAALRLGVTHSTVFRRIGRLEEELGVKLFSRLPEGFQLTDTGNNLFEYVEGVSGSIFKLYQFVENSKDDLSGDINVTAPHNIAYSYLPGYIELFRQQYPKIKIHLMVDNSDFDLNRGEADLAVRATRTPPDTLIGHKLFTLKWAAFAAPNYIEQHGIPNDINALHDHLVISSCSNLFKLKAYKWVENNIPTKNIVSRCNDLMSMSALAVEGIGIALLPDDQIKPELVRLFTLPFDATSDLWVLIHPNMRECKRLKVFRTYVITAFENDPRFKSSLD